MAEKLKIPPDSNNFCGDRVPRDLLSEFFTFASRKPAPPSVTQFGINKEDLLYELCMTLKQGVIEPYQAALIMVASLNLPVQPNGVTHPLQLINIHNDRTLSFAAKTDKLLAMAMMGGVTYPDLCRTGFTQDPKNPARLRTLFNLLYPEKELGPVTDQKPKHTKGIRRREVIKRDGLQSDLIQKTFSAIPKSRLLTILSKAVSDNTLGFEQMAMIIAVNCHSLETRDNGQRYLDHIMAVAADPSLTKTQKVIALLHDVIENSNLTVADFRDVRMPAGIIESLEAITIGTVINPVTGAVEKEPYLTFIRRVAANPDAAAVKIADIHHNMQDAPEARRTKYHLALGYLEAVKLDNTLLSLLSVEEWAALYMPDELRRYNQELERKAREEPKTAPKAEEVLEPVEPPSRRRYLAAGLLGLLSGSKPN